MPLFANAYRAGKEVFLGAHYGTDPETSVLKDFTIHEESERCLKNLSQIPKLAWKT